jgi:thiamine biosynthesis protein ThiS
LTIRLNGEPYELAGPVTISALLAELQIDPRVVAVEHNLVVIKRARYETTMVGEGDEVEVVRFVGGGSWILSSSPTAPFDRG